MRESEVEDLMAEVARLGDVDPKQMERTLTEFRDMASAHMYFAKGRSELRARDARRDSWVATKHVRLSSV